MFVFLGSAAQGLGPARLTVAKLRKKIPLASFFTAFVPPRKAFLTHFSYICATSLTFANKGLQIRPRAIRFWPRGKGRKSGQAGWGEPPRTASATLPGVQAPVGPAAGRADRRPQTFRLFPGDGSQWPAEVADGQEMGAGAPPLRALVP